MVIEGLRGAALVLSDRSNLTSLVLPIAGILAVTRVLRPGPWTDPRWRRLVIGILGLGSLLCFAAYAIHYTFLGTFYDDIETTVVSTVRLALRGAPIYEGPSDASRYSMLYGPNTYLVPLLAARVFGDSVTVFKILSSCFALGALTFTVAAVGSASGWRCGPLWTAILYFCGLAFIFQTHVVWLRADPQMLFWAAVALWAATVLRTPASFILLGVAAGALANLKIHGPLYLVPTATLLAKKGRPRDWLAAFSVAVAVAVLPFVVCGSVSLKHYAFWLSAASRHGLGIYESLSWLIDASLLGIPVAIAAFCRGRELAVHPPRTKVLVVVNLTALALLYLVGSKKGGGYWHVMPFLPLGAFLTAKFFYLDVSKGEQQPIANRPALAEVGLLSLAIVGTLGALAVVARVPGPIRAYSLEKAEVVSDIDLAVGDTDRSQVAIGFGGGNWWDTFYTVTYYRLDTKLSDRLILEPGAIRDMQQSGLELPASTLDAIRRGTIRTWLIPRGQAPFTLGDWYSDPPGDLFGVALRSAFTESYVKVRSTRFFDVWSFRVPIVHRALR